MTKRILKSAPALLLAALVAALAGCPGPGPDTARTLDSIAITGEPAKLAYAKGEALDLTGLEVTATWSDGATSSVEITDGHISYDSDAVGEVRVSITVQGKKAFFTITVTDPVSEVLAFGEAHAAVLVLSPSAVTAETAAELEADVDAALAAYRDLSAGAQALAAAQKETLDALKSRLDEFLALDRADAFRAAHETVLALKADTVTTDHEAALEAAFAAYNELNEAAGALLAPEKTLLENLRRRIGELKEKAELRTAHAAVLALTTATVSLDDEAAVDAALAAHSGLSEGAKELAAAEKALLDSLQIAIADLKAAEDADETDKAAAAVFVSAHEAVLGKTVDSIAVADEPLVDAALAAYNTLSPQVKALLGARKALLDSLKTKIEDIKTATAFRAEHAAVLSKDPAAASLADESALNAVIAAYDALSAGAKTLLAPEKAALDALAQAIGALREAEGYQAEAAEFTTAHAAVLGKTTGNIAVGDEAAVDSALAAYNALGAQVRALLTGQKTQLDSLKTKIGEYKAPAAAAEFRTAHAAVLSKNPDNITIADETAVNAALLGYNGLSAPAKELASAEKALLDSLKQKIAAFADQNAADAFKANHGAILSKTVETVIVQDEAAVDAALAAYNALRPGAKVLAGAEKSLLDQLKAKIAERIEKGTIFTAADLAKIGVDPDYPRDGSYTLRADIALNDWTPLCPDEARAFSGTFDGNGRTVTITGFNNAAVQDNSYIGIFGYVKGASSSAKALIRNVKVVSSVNASSARDGGQSLGLIAGYANMAAIEDIVLEGSLRFSALIGVVYVGGVAGWIEQETVVKNCDSSMTMDITGGYDVPLDPNIVVYSSVGGFVGLFKHRSEIRNCHNTGNIAGRAPRPSDNLLVSRGPVGDGSMDGPTVNDPSHAQVFAGGIAGGSFFAFVAGECGGIYNCSSYGDITATAGGWWAFAAGISGCFQGDDRMEYCVAGGTLSASSQYAYAGGMTAYGGYGSTVFYRCRFEGAIRSGDYYTYGPITGQYGSVIECDWTAAAAPEPAPQAIIDWSGKLTGLVANRDYTVNGAAKRADSSGCIGIEDAWFGSTVTIVKKQTNLVASGDSPPQSLAIPLRSAAPDGLSAGSAAINGVNASMEWAPKGVESWNTAAWTSCAGTSVTGLASGIYYVRYKQAGAAFPSANAVVAVSQHIMSAADLAKIGVDPDYPASGTYSLGADISVSNWTPLEFSGNFNGNGRRITIESFNPSAVTTLNRVGIFSTITGSSYETPVVIENLNISVGNGAYAGLNGLTLSAANVGTIAGRVRFALLSNIHVDGAAITFSAEDYYGVSLGGIVGFAEQSAIKGCGNSAAITAGASIVGGIVGGAHTISNMNTVPCVVEDCYATGAITTSSAGSTYSGVGGIVGRFVYYNIVKRCYFDGSITVARGNDSESGNSYTMTGIGGIVGHMDVNGAVEDCHSSGVFAGTGTNTAGEKDSGMALGGIVGVQLGLEHLTLQRCYSVAELNVQRNARAYAGGIVGFSDTNTAQISSCAALNNGISVEHGSGGTFGLHRITNGRPVLTRNIAWASMPLSTKETGQAAQPFTEAAADRVRTGIAGEDCGQKPAQQDYTALGWDFGTVWRMGSNGYPELR